MSSMRPRPSIDGVVCTTLLGALAGALVWWPLIMTQALESLPVTYQKWPAILMLHLGGGLFSLTCALAALWLRYRPAGNIRTGLVRVGSLFAVGAILASAVTVVFARSAGFSTGAAAVVAEFAIAVACCALGAGLGAAWWRRSVGTAHKH